jgi:hypothetical protein
MSGEMILLTKGTRCLMSADLVQSPSDRKLTNYGASGDGWSRSRKDLFMTASDHFGDWARQVGPMTSREFGQMIRHGICVHHKRLRESIIVPLFGILRAYPRRWADTMDRRGPRRFSRVLRCAKVPDGRSTSEPAATQSAADLCEPRECLRFPHYFREYPGPAS